MQDDAATISIKEMLTKMKLPVADNVSIVIVRKAKMIAKFYVEFMRIINMGDFCGCNCRPRTYRHTPAH